jgi:hypothetical protein
VPKAQILLWNWNSSSQQTPGFTGKQLRPSLQSFEYSPVSGCGKGARS